MRARSTFMPYLRRAIYDRDGAVCVFCGSDGNGRTLHLDHIIPWSQGGEDASWNLRPLCARCNVSRSVADTPDDCALRPPCAYRCSGCAPIETSCWGWCTSCHAYGDVSEADIDVCTHPTGCGCTEYQKRAQSKAERRARRTAAYVRKYGHKPYPRRRRRKRY